LKKKKLMGKLKLGYTYNNKMSAGIAVAPSRLAALKQLRCSIFQTSYNPQSLRTGAKYFRARLRGPSMLSYYPDSFNIAQIARKHPELELVNEDEEERLQDVLERKRRGKGPPKKAKNKGPSVSRSLSFARLLMTVLSAESEDSRRLGKKR
jgi:hypothetical protein